MPSTRSLVSQISTVRPLRPPSISVTAAAKITSTVSLPRHFTHRSQLLLIASHTPRPQLPYLSASPHARRSPSPFLQGQVLRLISTENRRFFKQQLWLATKWTIIGWTFLFLGAIAWFGITIERDERNTPTPAEWRFRTRQLLRWARAATDEEEATATGGIVDWAKVGSHMAFCLSRIEDKNYEGKDLEEAAGDETLIPGVGKAGFDIGKKSWPWRAGYCEVIMICAKAAEHLDGMVLDTTRRIVFPADVMIGPSNPDPRPVPPYMKEAPLEENCVAPYQPPETFYMKILTGRGFTTGQQIDAALAYAHWLEFKGLNDAASEMYKWSIDIAAGALPAATKPERIIDKHTLVIKENAEDVTPNLLRTTTALAIHHARTGNLDSALPILLSVLRARRTAPVSPFPPPTPTKPSFSLWDFLFVPPQFPEPPPSGDIPLLRPTSQPTCTESELMLYIGEILFASSRPNTEEGLAWTKQGVTIAETQLADRTIAQADDWENMQEKRKCTECLATGVGNWEVMLSKLREEPDLAKRTGRSWVGLWNKGSPTAQSDKQVAYAEDQLKIEELKHRMIRESMNGQVKAQSQTGIWIG